MYDDKKRNFLFYFLFFLKLLFTLGNYSIVQEKDRVAYMGTLKQKHNSIANHSLIPSH